MKTVGLFGLSSLNIFLMGLLDVELEVVELIVVSLGFVCRQDYLGLLISAHITAVAIATFSDSEV